MTKFKSSKSGLVDWMIAGVLGSIAAVLYFSTMSGYAFPGESARLMVHWRGLDLAVVNEYPLMAVFAGIFGFGNAIAPVCGAVAVACIYRLTSFFVRERIGGEMVSLAAVEDALKEIWPDAVLGVVTIPDERKGEQLALVIDTDNVTTSRIAAHFASRGLSPLWTPKRILCVKEAPLLGSGKFDYRAAKELVTGQKG